MIVQNFEILSRDAHQSSKSCYDDHQILHITQETNNLRLYTTCLQNIQVPTTRIVYRKKERKKEGKVVERERERDKKFERSEWVLNKLGQQEYQLQHLQQQQQQTCLRSR